MKNLKTFKNYEYNELDEGLVDWTKDKAKKIKEKVTVSPIIKFKTILAYYHKMNNMKNVKYWLENLVENGLDSNQERINGKYNSLKPRFVVGIGGDKSTRAGHEDLIKELKNKPTAYDNIINDDIEAYLPGNEAKIRELLNISVKENVIIKENLTKILSFSNFSN